MSNHTYGPPLDLLPQVHVVMFMIRELKTVFLVGSPVRGVDWENHLP